LDRFSHFTDLQSLGIASVTSFSFIASIIA
jgi:hypothetical protein